jgi:hypothetical protein
MAVSYTRLNSAVRDKFGIDITFTPAGGVARTITAIIDRTYFAETGTIGIQTESFVLNVVDADVPELAAGDAFTVAAINYLAVEIQPDFYGMTNIILNKA